MSDDGSGTISQVTINYRHCALSEGHAGGIYGGDRLPWIAVGDFDNYEPLNAMTWQVHVYGTASTELRNWYERNDLPLHMFRWRQEYANAGFAQDALYLIRPHTYVALAIDRGAVSALQGYFDGRGIKTEAPRGAHKHAA